MKTLIGFISGIVATGPMTALMVIGHKRLPQLEQYTLPPGEIVKELGKKTGMSVPAKKFRHHATLISHFGYGAATGAIYSAAEEKVKGHPALKGMGFGLAVWGLSYLGTLPALNVLKPATEHPMRRNALMIGSHLVWGATLGAFVHLLKNEARRLSTHSTPHHDVEPQHA